MSIDIEDVLYDNKEQLEKSETDKEKYSFKELDDVDSEANIESSDKLEKASGNTVSRYLLSFFIDFIIFGIVFLIILLLKDTVLMRINGDANRVLVLNSITVLVIEEIFLFTYFHFFSKDNGGSTLGRKILKIKVTDTKGKVNLLTNTLTNIPFWFFFLLINIEIVMSLGNLNIDIGAILLLILLLIGLLLLNGFRTSRLKVSFIDEEISDEDSSEDDESVELEKSLEQSKEKEE